MINPFKTLDRPNGTGHPSNIAPQYSSRKTSGNHAFPLQNEGFFSRLQKTHGSAAQPVHQPHAKTQQTIPHVAP
jgi:hypothetical protein